MAMRAPLMVAALHAVGTTAATTAAAATVVRGPSPVVVA
jgi:hypothetical protein